MSRVQIASVIFALAGLTGVFELVRRRLIGERYALLWLGAALVLLVLAIWQGLLFSISRAVGIATPSNAFFVIALGFAIVLLLHFTIATSKLADQTRVLAQRLALVEARLHELDRKDPAGPAGPAEVGRHADEAPASGRALARP